MTNNDQFAKITIIHSELKEGTKGVYQEIDREEEIISREYYNNCIDASPFFRRLGGTEYQEKNYTEHGYITTRIISKSPDRTKKTERIFDFNI